MKLLINRIFIVLLLITLSVNIFASDETGISNRSDIMSNRNSFTPRAKTLEKGEIIVNFYEFIFAGFSFGITDSLQFDIGTMIFPPLAFSTTSFKYAIIDNSFLTLSVQPTLTCSVLFAIGGSYTGGLICDIRPTSNFTISSGLHAGPNWIYYYVYAEDEKEKDKYVFEAIDQDYPYSFLADLSIEYKLHAKFSRSNLKLISELITVGTGNSDYRPSGEIILLIYGLRASNEKAGIDICLIKSFINSGNDDYWYTALGVPYISAGYKF